MDTTLDDSPAAPAAPDSGPPSAPRRPRLHRNTSERVLGGVAAGIADHFGIDALLIRLGFVVAAFFGGIGVIAYLVAWIVLPSATPGAPPAPRDNRQLLGFGLVALGLATIPSGLGFAWRLDGAFWPLALIALGGAVLWLRTRDDHDDHDDQPPPAPPAPATPASSPTPTSSFAAEPGPTPTADATAPVPPAPRAAREARRAKPPRGPVTAITLSALLILGGLTWIIAAAGWATVDFGAVSAIALAIVGAGLVASAWIGRARGLVALGLFLALVVGAFAAVDVPIRGGVGDATYAPATHARIRDHYRMAIGRLELDFGRGVLAGRRTEVSATVGIGRLVVRVPQDVRLVVHGHAGVGSVSLLGRDRGSCCPTDEHIVRAGTPGRGTLVLHARVGAGEVDVSRAPVVPPAPNAPAPPAESGTPSVPTVPTVPSVPREEVSRAAA